MKKTMFAVLASLLAAQTVSAAPLTFRLFCKRDKVGPVGAPILSVLKVAFKKGNKWDSKYQLEVRPMNPTAEAKLYNFTSAGSGDEDYNEFNLVDPQNKTGIQGAYIQNSFKWVSLIDNNGSASFDCRKND